MRCFFRFFSLITWVAFPGIAQDSMKTSILDPIMVTGTHLEPIRSNVPNAVTLIGRSYQVLPGYPMPAATLSDGLHRRLL